MHVAPRPERLIRSRLGAHPKHVSVEILDLHLTRPREVGGWLANLGTATDVFRVNRVNVVDANPYPAARVALISLHEKKGAPASGNGSDRFMEIDAEPEHVDVVPDARFEIRDAEYRLAALEDWF